MWARYVGWAGALCLFLFSCVFMSFHQAPLPLDLSVTKAVQHLALPDWLNTVLNVPSYLNDPLPSIIALVLWVIFFALIGLIERMRGRSARPWWFAGMFLALAVQVSAALNVVIDELVKRQRPLPADGIHVVGPIVPFPTYPSGHTEHDMVYYGFLLYLSCSGAVRRWRYRWLLLPLQGYAVFDMLVIGFSRIALGDHWVTDVLGGYLEGLIYLCLFIFLYHLTERAWRRRSGGKRAGLSRLERENGPGGLQSDNPGPFS